MRLKRPCLEKNRIGALSMHTLWIYIPTFNLFTGKRNVPYQKRHFFVVLCILKCQNYVHHKNPLMHILLVFLSTLSINISFLSNYVNVSSKFFFLQILIPLSIYLCIYLSIYVSITSHYLPIINRIIRFRLLCVPHWEEEGEAPSNKGNGMVGVPRLFLDRFVSHSHMLILFSWNF